MSSERSVTYSPRHEDAVRNLDHLLDLLAQLRSLEGKPLTGLLDEALRDSPALRDAYLKGEL